MSALLARYRALPRALRWLALFAAFMAFYFFGVEYVLGMTAKYNVDADRLAAELNAKSEMRSRIADAAARVEALVGFYGQPGQPAAEEPRRAELRRQINQVFSDHKVANKRETYKDLAPLSSDAAKPAAGAGPRIGKVAVELAFESDLTTLTAILRDLEASTAVSSLPKLSVRKVAAPGGGGGGGRNREPVSVLQVNMTVESWIAMTPAPSSAKNGAGSAEQ